jgi:hypothetical protein
MPRWVREWVREAVPDPLKTEYFSFAGGSFYKIEGGIVSTYFKKYKTWEPVGNAVLAEWVRNNMTKINATLVPLEAFIAPASGVLGSFLPEAGGPGR